MSNTSITDNIAAIQALAAERDTLANALAAADELIADLYARLERADAELARAEERRRCRSMRRSWRGSTPSR